MSIWKRVLPQPLSQPGHLPLRRMVQYIDHFMSQREMHRGIVGSPKVTIAQNFDNLLFPKDHPGRSKSDTYYCDSRTLLRTHATCHQNEMLSLKKAYWICDTYRRDEIDRTHYPIFHQMDAIYLINKPDEEVIAHMKAFLESFVSYMLKETLGQVEMRWVDAYFPFTYNSLELEIFYRDQWLELLGGGIIHQDIQKRHDIQPGWAFGIGLERLCMLLYNIQDIRLFWSRDDRFIKQFSGEVQLGDSVPKQMPFVPFSRMQPCYKDISFFVDDSGQENPIDAGRFDMNDVHDILRDYEDLEEVKVQDAFYHPKKQKWSLCLRLTFRAWDRTLENEQVMQLINDMKKQMVDQLGLEMR